MRKSVGTVIWLFLLGVMALFAQSVFAETLSWNSVTTYTDGSTIASPVTYSVYDNVYHATNPIASGLPATSWGITNKGSGLAHSFAVSAVVGGVEGAKSARFNWTSPLLSPAPPTGLGVQ